MFGSRNDDDKVAKRRPWPWGKRHEQDQSDETVETPPATQTDNKEPENTSDAKVDVNVDSPSQPSLENKSKEKSGLFSRMRKKFEKQGDTAVADSAEASQPEVEQVTTDQAAEEQVTKDQAVKDQSAKEQVTEDQAVKNQVAKEQAAQVPPGKSSFFSRMRKGLDKTRNVLVEGVTELFIGKKEIDDDLLEELETQLLVADVGVEATNVIMENLTRRVQYKELDDADALIVALKTELARLLEPADKPLVIDSQKKPYVILVVGVNGVGKTTTIGKIACQLQKQGKSVMLAAGDTFRAAAVEQLQVWGERNRIPVIAQHTGADSASVIYDAFEAAKARGADVLIADTAGRLQNKDNLMEELKKVKRVLGKLDDSAPHEVMLVLDAGTGQNALSQGKLFNEAVGLTGMTLTKLDGTAKGGVIFALSRQMRLPIRYLGVGEQINDLQAFEAKLFVDALFDTSKL
ncbi:signal recognition particle-docking protein FtsY [Candidatus Sororendozoicomonas aggregata]|uniref:signal recognition particle-docking protein FtsY n=1 Tax=Candidatus Sororendozoicomonas aggregata TaxID=3073239 RepID=UPI002ED1EC33